MKNSLIFRKLLSNKEIIVLPGVYDCISAKIAEKVGFKLLFTSGFGISASSYGKPDYGLVSSSEMINSILNIINSVNVPLVADIDNGYGNYLNVIETLNKLIKYDVAGVILEDQKWPKRCGHMDGKQVVNVDEYIEKLKAARSVDNDLVIIARTDSRAVYNLDTALERGNKYLEAGADILFIEAPQSLEELEIIGNSFPNNYLFANMVEGGKTPLINSDKLKEMGYKIVVYPLTGLFSSVFAMQNSYQYLFKNSTIKGFNELINFSEFEEIIDLDFYKRLEDNYKN